MAAKKKATTKRKATAKKAPAPSKAKPEATGTVALVLRVAPAALTYIDAHKGDRPRTAYLRDVLAKGDAGLAKVLA